MTRTRRQILGTLCLIITAAVVPRWVCGQKADAYYKGDINTQDALAQTVMQTIRSHPQRVFYQSGYRRFDGQSAVAIYQMTLLGLGQIILAHPEMRDAYLPLMRTAADRLADPKTLRYAADAYGQHAVVGMKPGEGHAYAGYINMGLGMLRLVDPHTKHAALNDRLTAAFIKRLNAANHGLIETYPDETWPPDVAAVIGSIGLHGRATGQDHTQMLDRWAERFARCAIDNSGYLIQRVRSQTCDPVDAPRGSGTAVAAYFIHFAHPQLARRLYEGLVQQGQRDLFGFGAFAEYAQNHRGRGDTNSGPVIFGLSVGATGFGLGAARVHEDRAVFRRLYRTTALFGIPLPQDNRVSYVMGGVLGNALLLAMLTAGPS